MTLETGTYLPSEEEPYMNDRQVDWFRQKLIHQRDTLRERCNEKVALMREAQDSAVEWIDRSIQEAERHKRVREVMQARKLLEGTEAALKRIRTGQFGFCILTGEEIGLKRLLAKPTAPLCMDAQALFEKDRKIHARERILE